MNRRAFHLLCIVCAFVGSMAFADRAAAAVRPYSARGTAQFVSPTTFVGAGQATHLGRYSESGSVAFTPTANPAVFQVTGTIVYTAANGDELHAMVSGTLNGVTGVVAANLTYVGGTGRFANASGSSTLAGQSQPGGAISITVSGSINY